LETRITNDLHAYFGISASDDGKTIVTAQRNTAKDIWTASVAETNNFRKLTAESNVYSNAVRTPDGRIVFDALDNNRPHIWIMNGDGTGTQQLSPNDAVDYEPRVSPDGRFIVFTSRRGGETKIWRMNADGSSPQLLTPVNEAAYGPAVTPDGQTVLFQWAKESNRVLGRVPLAGGAITEQHLYSANTNLFAFSPDGRQVAYAFYDEAGRGYKVRVRPVETDEPSIVFNISPVNFLLWTADGKGLLYREVEPSRASSSMVWRQPISGGEPKQFLDVKPDQIFNLSLSADGKQILVVRGKLLTDAVMLTQIK
jgi:Tol biopolymer transport system component